MRRNSVNKALATGCIALAMMMAVSPITAQAAGLKSIQASRNISYIALKDCSQSMIVKRLKLLGMNEDCFKWVEDVLDQLCVGIPNIPCEPSEPEQPTTPNEPSTPNEPTEPSEPEVPTTPEEPTEPSEPEVPEMPTTPSEPTEPSEPEVPTTPSEPTEPSEPETPTMPSEPTEPSEPEVPTTPIVPSEPIQPEKPTTPVEPETPTAPSQPESSFASQVIELVNVERAKEGLKPLAYDATIEQAALVRAKEIQTSFSHTRPNGTSFVTAMKEAGVTYRMAGENIAWGQRTPEQVVSGWMNSPSHRANIMNANYGRIGVGHLTNARGTSYWVQLFAN